MIEIRNLSDEPFEIVTSFDSATPGFRILLDSVPEPQVLDPGKTVVLLGYEPGVLLRLRPVHNAGQPRGDATAGRAG